MPTPPQLPPQFQVPPALDLTQVRRTMTVGVHNADTFTYTPHPAVQQIAVSDGALFIDGEHIPNATFHRNFVRFTHTTPSQYSSGVLNFSKDAHAVTGTVFVGPTAVTAEPHEIAAVVAPTVYETKVSTVGARPAAGQQFPAWAPPEPADPSKWVEGNLLIVGYTLGPSGSLPTPVYQLAPAASQDAAQDLSTFIAPSVDPANHNLILSMGSLDPGTMEFGTGVLGPQFPAAFITEMAWDGNSFRGVLQHYDVATGQLDPTQYAWHGTVKAAAVVAPSPAAAASPVRVTAVRAVRQAPVPVQTAPAAESNTEGLSMAELFTLQPDVKTLQDDQFSLLIENMKFAIGADSSTQSWLNDFFGERQPSGFGSDRLRYVGTDAHFLRDRFAVAYLGSALDTFTGAGAPTTKLSDAQRLDLRFYLQAGLATEPGYNNESQQIFLEAFINALPRLSMYISDASGNWAQQLFDQLTTPQQLNMVVSKLMAGGGMEDANRHATLLRALQPSADLAQTYHKWIVTTLMSQSVNYLNLDDRASIQAWLGNAIQAFISAFDAGQISDADTPGSSPIPQVVAADQAAAIKAAIDEAGNLAELVARLTDLAVGVAEGLPTWSKLGAIGTAWQKAGYRFAQSIYVMGFLGATMSCVMAFRQWDKLDDNAKADAVASVGGIAGLLVESMPEILDTAQDWSFAAMGKLRACFAKPEVNRQVVAAIEGGDEASFGEGVTQLRKLARADATELELEGSAWRVTFSKTIGPICKCVGVAASIVFAYTATKQFIDDIGHGQDTRTEALDGVIAAASIGVAFCALAELTLAVTLPGLGALLAIVGLVAAVVEMFDPPPPPPPPAEVFMQQRVVPAFASSGPAGWILPAPAGWSVDAPVPQANAYSRAASQTT
jgi:hypothetical protein